MENANKLALRAGGWYVLSNFLIKGVGIISTPIITRLLSPTDYGISITYVSVMGIMTIISTLDIYSCVQIARYDYEEDEMASFLSSILTVSSLSLGIMYLIIKLMGSHAENLMGVNASLINFMFLNILLANAFTILQTDHKAHLKYKEFTILSVIVAIASPILSIILVSMQESNLYVGRIVGNALPQMIISFFIFIYIYKNGKTLYNKTYWKYALAISIPMIPHHLSSNILSQFDKVMINHYIGSLAVGLYSLAYSYASILSIIWTSFNQAWVPWFYGKMKENNHNEIKKYIKPYTMIFSIFFIGMLVGGPEALKIFGPEEYWHGRWVIPPVLLGIFFQFIYSLYVNIEFYFKKTRYIAMGTFVAAIVNFILNINFIPRFGYISAAYTTLIGYILLFILHYFISKRWISEDVIGTNFVLKWIVLITSVTAGITFLYPYPILRYSIFITSCFFIIYFNRMGIKMLYSLIKNKN